MENTITKRIQKYLNYPKN